MTSQINPNNINGNYPVAGVDNNSQGFRDNFTNTRNNFQYAKDEISDLETKAVLKAALTGQTLDNNMADNLIYAARIRDFSATRVAVSATSGSIALDYSAGHYQTISTAGSVSLTFLNFPPSGSYGLMRLRINITNVAHTMTIPVQVSRGLSGIQGISPGISGVSNTITFGSTGYYEFAFGSSDGGIAITLFDLNRALVDFTSANLQTTDLTASGNVTAGGNIAGANISSSSTVSAVGNITGGNVISIGTISTSGTVSGGTVGAIVQFSTTGNVVAGNVVSRVNASAGTTTIAPIKISTGALLATPQLGSIEYDGSVFYATPSSGSSSSQRGVWPSRHMILTPAGGRTLTQNTNAQSVFDNPASGSLVLTDNTTYEMEAYYVVTNDSVPSTAHSISVLFASTASLLSINYIADITTSSGDPIDGATTIARNHGTTVSALQITPSGTTTNSETVIVYLRGIVRVNTSGTFVPQIKYNTNAPGGTSVVTENSWFQMSALGDGSLVSVGNWS